MRAKGPRGRRALGGLRTSAPLPMMGLMDVFTVLVLFLLKSIVTDGEASAPPSAIHLPVSNAEASVPPSTVITIDGQTITVGGEAVASVGEVANADRMFIEPLAERLESMQKAVDDFSTRQGVGRTETHVVTIQGDHQIEFRVLEKVMYTLNQTGYEDIVLAVTLDE